MSPGRRADLSADLRAALPAWVLARVIVAGTLVAARAVTHYLVVVPEPIRRHVHQGLLGWDAQRYHQIATSGYAPLPRIQLRFFPLLPLLSRALSTILPGGRGFAILVVANAAALAFGMLLHRLALHETGDQALAQRAAWFAALFPAAFVLVWGYSESLWALLAVAAVFAARRSRWWWAAAIAVFAGLIRPVGILLSVPLAVEGLVQLRRSFRWGDAVARATAVAAPAFGTAAYLAWVWHRFGDPLLPYTIQESSHFRGKPVSPWTALHRPLVDLLDGRWTVDSTRVIWTVVLLALIVVCLRRWPLCYGAFAAACFAIAISTSHLGSFERYTFSSFPILLALASVTAKPTAERVALAVGSGTMAIYGLLALLGPYVP